MAILHFNLRHISRVADLCVHVHGEHFELHPHTPESHAQARERHPVLRALPDEGHKAFSHFSKVDDAVLQTGGVRFVQVIRPALPGVHLHEVVLIAQHFPKDHLQAYYERKIQLQTLPKHILRAFHRLDKPPRLHTGKLAALGLNEPPTDNAAAFELLYRSQELVTSLDTASTLVAHHPDLANTQPYVATIVQHDHILPDPAVNPTQYNAMQVLKTAIDNLKDQPWSPVIPCKDQHGQLLQAGYNLGDASAGGLKRDQQLYTYGVADPVLHLTPAATGGARRTASNDPQLANQLWSPTPGTTALKQEGGTVGNRAQSVAFASRAASAGTAFKWTVSDRTDHHGVSVDQSSITVDSADAFSIDASNRYARTLYVGYQLYGECNEPIGKQELLYSISATNSVLGIPVPTDPTSLHFNLNGAASVVLSFGSFGTTDWEADVSTNGALLTGLWQYGIPIVFMAAGKAITSTRLFNAIVDDRDLTTMAIAIAFPIVGGGVATAAGVGNTKKVLFGFANVVLGIAVQKGMEKLGEWLLTQVAAGEITRAFGPVGWLFSLAAVAMNVEAMAITTGEVLSSPATIRVKVSRAIDVALRLHPDPRGGEIGHAETAVWPAVASRYVATLQYKDGTNRILTGLMPSTTSNAPLPLTFQDVPAGGQLRILAGVYSASGWLAGTWQSDWMDVKPNQGTTLDLGDPTITENLVPLAPDTQYVFKERIVNQGGTLAWQAGGAPPVATRSSLNCGDSGTLCDIVALTINNSAAQLGYAWRASGQALHPDNPTVPSSNSQLYALQNLSRLADPSSRLITTSIGFTERPGIAYAPSTNAKTNAKTNETPKIDQTNFVLDPRGGGMNLRQVLLSEKQTDFGFGQPQLSWGSFPLENIDALAIHPSNAVIACSYQEHKLMILNLPAFPSPDGQAPAALMVSGEGIRQGLLQGPKALAIAPDGRILVLEALNLRVQAFDTKGNPVPSFTPGPSLFALPTDQIAATLDAGQIPEAFQAALQSNSVTWLFSLSSSFTAQLDSGKFQPSDDPLINALSQQGVLLAYDPTQMSDPTSSAQIQVVESGQSWIITDPRGAAWQVLNQSGTLNLFSRPTQVEVHAEKAGETWLLIDHRSGSAWKLVQSSGTPGQTEVRVCLSFFPLRTPRRIACIYLDMAVEAMGYIYILQYWNDGTKPTDYVLDVYAPDGTFSFRTPDPSVTTAPQNVVAQRMAVDIFRNLYALNYETLKGPAGTVQPGLAHWMPTPPLFSLDLAKQVDFNQKNIGTVSNAFAAAPHEPKITLSPQAFILVNDPDGAWQVKDGTTIYYVYRSGDCLQVFSVPA